MSRREPAIEQTCESGLRLRRPEFAAGGRLGRNNTRLARGPSNKVAEEAEETKKRGFSIFSRRISSASSPPLRPQRTRLNRELSLPLTAGSRWRRERDAENGGEKGFGFESSTTGDHDTGPRTSCAASLVRSEERKFCTMSSERAGGGGQLLFRAGVALRVVCHSGDRSVDRSTIAADRASHSSGNQRVAQDCQAVKRG